MDTPTRIPEEERSRLLTRVEALVEYALTLPSREEAERVQLRIYKEYGDAGVPEVYALVRRVDEHFDGLEAAQRAREATAMALQQRQVEAMERVASALEGQASRRTEGSSAQRSSGAAAERSSTPGVPPAVLTSPEAERLWEALREAGFIRPGSYELAEGVSDNQATYIAALMNEELHLGTQWKMYRELWGTRYMAQYAGGWQQTGKLPPKYKEIERALHSSSPGRG